MQMPYIRTQWHATYMYESLTACATKKWKDGERENHQLLTLCLYSKLSVWLQSQQPLRRVSAPAATGCVIPPQSPVHFCGAGQRYTETHNSHTYTSFSHHKVLPSVPRLQSASAWLFSFNPRHLDQTTTHIPAGEMQYSHFPIPDSGKKFSWYCTWNWNTMKFTVCVMPVGHIFIQEYWETECKRNYWVNKTKTFLLFCY